MLRSKTKRILIIGNPLSGIRPEKKAVIDAVAESARKKGASVDVTFIMKRGQGRRHAAHASLEGYDAVYAAGGDGTISEIASGMVNQDIPLGIIPLGTGNGLARSLGMPLNTKRIIDMLSKEKTGLIDCGKISSQYFFATAGIGFDAVVAFEFNMKRGEKTGIFDYVWTAVTNYLFKASETVSLQVDGGKDIKRKFFGLTFCNTKQYGSGAIIAPHADPYSGQLIAVVIPKMSIFKIPFAIKRLFNGTLNESNYVEYIPFKTLKVTRKKPGMYHADGETFEGNSTFTISTFPQSLTIILP